MPLMQKLFSKGREGGIEQQVLSHLERLLNSRMGYDAWQVGFGLDTYASFDDSKGVAEDIRCNIAETIKTYEPRVEILSVEYLGGEGGVQLGFCVHCRIRQSKHSFNIALTPPSKCVVVEVDT